MGLSFSQRLGLRLGIEELAEGATGEEGEVGGTAVLPDAPEETVEGGLMEAGEAEAVVEEETAEAEQLEDSVETLEKIALGLETAMKNGGCTAGEAYAYQIGLESAFRPFGMGATATASLENIGSARNPRLEATRVTLEGVKETLQKWWAGLVAMWEKVYNSIKGWLMKVFDSITPLKKRADEIIRKAGAAKGSPKKDKIAFDSKSISTGDAAVTAESVAAGIEVVREACDSGLVKAKGVYGVATALLLTGLREAVDGKMAEGSDEKIIDDLMPKIETPDVGPTMSKFVTAPKEKYGGDGIKATISSSVLLGNKAVLVTVPADLKKDGKFIGVASAMKAYNLKLVDGTATPKDEKEVPAADAPTVKAIAVSVTKICDTLLAYRGVWQERDKSKSLLSAEVKKEVTKISSDKDATAEKTKLVKECGTALQSYASKNSNFTAQLSSYGLRAGQVALNYANKCLENLGEAAA